MKIFPMINVMALAALTAASLSTAVVAQDRPGRDGFPFEEMDADKDGKVTRDEIAAHRTARFAAADADKDGKLSASEMTAAAETRAKDRAAARIGHIIEQADKDGDGLLTMAEMTAPHGDRMFRRIDADDDGVITRAEFDEARKKHGERRGRKQHGGGN